MAGVFKIAANARRRLGIDGKRLAPAALADRAQGSEAAVLMQVADIQRREIRAPESDLQASRKNGAIT